MGQVQVQGEEKEILPTEEKSSRSPLQKTRKLRDTVADIFGSNLP